MEPFILLRFQQGFSYCYGNIITRWYFSGIRRPQKSSSDLQRENEWRREPQPRKSRSRSIIPSSRKQLNFPLRLPFHQSICRESSDSLHPRPLWVRKWYLGFGLYLTPIFHTPRPCRERATSEWHSLLFLPLQGQKIKSCGGNAPHFHKDETHSYPFEHYSFRNIYFYQPAGHINLTVFNNFHIFIKQVMRSRNKS